VTLLGRLTGVFGRLAGTAVKPVCPACGAPTVLEREDAAGQLPVVLEQVFACVRRQVP
jgi:hypothetical protein